MLFPTTADVIRVIHRTLETGILPALKGTEQESAAVTMGHMLRYLALRVELEGPRLAEDIAKLRSTLVRIEPYLKARGYEDARALALHQSVEQSLNSMPDIADYRDIAQLAAEVSALRRTVCLGIDFFQAQTALDAEGSKARDLLLEYISWEVMQDAELMDPPFEGFGARR